MSMILNADRDMYQAYVAMRDILSLDETVKNMMSYLRITKKI